MLEDNRRATNPAAVQVLKILQDGGYRTDSGQWISIRQEQRDAESGTRLSRPGDALDPETTATDPAPHLRVEVVDATTQKAAQMLASEGEVLVLNFASARNPGGGFLGGARAQEEELCRCSGLYRCLLTQPDYYHHHRAERSLLYSDHMIYSPRVPFVRLSAEQPLLDRPFPASVVTAPAPNVGAIRRHKPADEKQVGATFRRRWGRVLAMAAQQGHGTVVLGAWGCGAFRNDPYLVADAARSALGGASRSIARVIFAVPNQGSVGSRNQSAFKAVIEG